MAAPPRLLAPVFLVAAPRSGARLLFEWLSQVPAFSPLAQWPDAEEKAQLEEALYRTLHHRDQRLLVYDDSLASRVGELAALFPEAQFLWCFREPVAAIEAGGVEPWVERTTALLDAIDALDGNRWMAVNYERLLESDDELARVCTFLGVPRPRTIARPAPTPSEAIVARARAKLATTPAKQQEVRVDLNEAFRSTSTASFPEILHALGASLVVTTYQSGRVVLVRAPDRTTLNTHVRSLPNPMGVAAAPNLLAIGTKQEIVEYHNQPAVAARLDPPNANDAVLVPRNVHVTGDIRIHEMAFSGRQLWVVNTLFSALCTIDQDHSFVPRWQPRFITGLAAEDRCHLNGMAMEGGRVRYVSAFGETDTAGGWRANKINGGVVLDVDSGETVIRGLSMPHSPRLYRDRFWILESGRGTLAAADPRTGAVETIAQLPGFTRGLAFAKQFAFIGLSQVRESNVFGGIPLVESVKERECGVWVVDLRTGEVAAFLRFEGVVHEIFDVQVLHGTCYPELLDLTDERIASSYVVPGEPAQG